MIHSNSRYLKTKTFIDRNGATIMYNRTRMQFTESNCTKYYVTASDTLEVIAFKQLGSVDYKWAILDANPHYLSEFDITQGDTILIPSIDEVRSFYGK